MSSKPAFDVQGLGLSGPAAGAAAPKMRLESFSEEAGGVPGDWGRGKNPSRGLALMRQPIEVSSIMVEHRANIAAHLVFTGERFHPEVSGQIAFEHLHRYYFAKGLIAGCRVLDVACGEGYGSAILASAASEVVGVDIAADAVAHARSKYELSNLSFVGASAADLPFEDATFDAVVSFETIEHHDLQERMLAEVKRVLKPEGLLVISSPNRQFYSIERSFQNPFHVRELFTEQFVALIGAHFSEQILFGQRVVHGSLLVAEAGSNGLGFESAALHREACRVDPGLAKPLYDIIVASDITLPALRSSLFESTVHDLDAATFYGVHLPDRVAQADGRIVELEQKVAERGLSERDGRELFGALRARLDDIVDGEQALLRERLGRVSAELDRSHQEARRAQEDFQGAEQLVMTLRGEIALLHQRLLDADSSWHRAEEAVLAVRADELWQRAQLEECRKALDHAGSARAAAAAEAGVLRHELMASLAQLDRIARSRSWRATGWLRRISAVLRKQR